MKTAICSLAALVVSAACFTPSFAGGVTVDGDVSDIGIAVTSNTLANSFGAGLIDLHNLRVASDASNLYIGIASNADATGGTRGFWFFLDSKSGGLNPMTGISNGPGGAQGLNDVAFEPGFTADYLYFWQNGDVGNRQNYFLDRVDLQANTAQFHGTFNVSTNSFGIDGGAPAGFEADVDNTETLTGAAATKGFEFKIPYANIGMTLGDTVKILVGSGDGGNGFWSSHSLPDAGNGSNNLGQDPNFATNTVGAFGTAGGFSGVQEFVYTTGTVASVEQWSLYE